MISGFDVDFAGDLARMSLEQISEWHLKPYAGHLAHIICESAYEASKPLLMT